jgi:hypothetical protein
MRHAPARARRDPARRDPARRDPARLDPARLDPEWLDPARLDPEWLMGGMPALPAKTLCRDTHLQNEANGHPARSHSIAARMYGR